MRMLACLLILFCVAAEAAPPKRAKPANAARVKAFEEPGTLPRRRPPDVGDSGKLVEGRAFVVHVIDEHSLIAQVFWYSPATVDNPHGKMEKSYAWMTVSTEGLIDDRVLRFDQTFEVVGTKRYGSKTVPELQIKQSKHQASAAMP